MEYELARTEMSVVYLARETSGVGRSVALKVLNPVLAADPDFRERFRREVELASGLEHPNVIPVYSAHLDGPCFIAMRYVNGSNLGELLEGSGTLDLPTVVRILSQVAAALDAAHAVGLVHRDVKPGNILLDTRSGNHVYLLDFGIAKQVSAATLTRTGSFLGTAAYASPEQIDDQDVDGRADIYALGCVLYQCLTGGPPFPRSTLLSILNAHKAEPPPRVTDQRPDLPAAVDSLVARAMAKDPADRFATCRDLAAGLEELAGSARPARPAAFEFPRRTSGGPPEAGRVEGQAATRPFAGSGAEPATRPSTEASTAQTTAHPAEQTTAYPAEQATKQLAGRGAEPAVAERRPVQVERAPGPAPALPAPPPGRRRSRKYLAAAAVAVLGLSAIAVVASVLLDGGQPTPEALARVPPAFRASCQPAEDGRGFDRATENLVCRDEQSRQEVRFGLFDSRSELDATYAEAVGSAGLTRGSGDCTLATGAEHRYPGVGDPSGRALCYSRQGTTTLVWSDDRTRTLARADTRSAGDVELIRSWTSWARIPSYPTRPERRLLNVVELTECRRAPAGGLDGFQGLVAALECASEEAGARTVSYYRFATLGGLTRTYNSHVSQAKAPSGLYCADGDAPGFLGDDTWVLGGDVDLGRVLCRPGGGGEYVIEWTVEPLLLLGSAVGGDSGELAEWWEEESGPPSATIIDALNRRVEPPFPTTEERALLKHVPPPARKNCFRPAEERIDEEAPTRPVAAVVCGPVDAADDLYYYQFSDQASMEESYQTFVEGESGLCEDIPPGFEGSSDYRVGGEVVGKLGCGNYGDDSYYLVWTNEQLNIEVVATDASDPEELLDWWGEPDESGPLP